MIIVSPCATSYVIAMAIYALSFTFSKCTWPLSGPLPGPLPRPLPGPLEWVKVTRTCANRKAICNFVFVSNSNVWAICHHLFEKIIVEMWMTLNLTLTFKVVQGQIYANRKSIWDFIFAAIVMFCLSIIILEIYAVEMCMTLTLTFRLRKDRI